ncbi:MAG: ribosome silencing factor [Actinomycetota bacterium]
MTGSRQLATLAARAAAEKQGRDVAVLDVKDLIAITDYFVICSGANDRQVKTIAEEIEKALRGRGIKPVRREGERESRWVLLDFVDFVAHVFHEEDRDYYGLDRLWADAPPVAWETAAASSG